MPKSSVITRLVSILNEAQQQNPQESFDLSPKRKKSVQPISESHRTVTLKHPYAVFAFKESHFLNLNVKPLFSVKNICRFCVKYIHS